MKTDTNITISGLMRLTGLSRARIRGAISTVKPVEHRSGVDRFLLSETLPAIFKSTELPNERTERLRADLIEHKLKAMRSESLTWATVRRVWHYKFKRLARALESAERLNSDERKRLVRQVEQEIARIPDELRQCAFSEGDDPDDERKAEPDTAPKKSA